MNNKVIWTFDDSLFEEFFNSSLNLYLNIINQELNINIIHINNQLVSNSDSELELVSCLMDVLKFFFKEKLSYQPRDLVHMIKYLKNSSSLEVGANEIKEFYNNKVFILNSIEGKRIYAKTLLQKKYIELLKTSAITFAIGAAGSGKTYLAVAYAIASLKKNTIKKIIITRPVVEAGEKLGFLPGDLKEKVDPYLIPIYDAIEEFVGKEAMDRYVEKGIIEIAPLAYMRGRTLDNAIIILDEAQNTTTSQMKMFLTRLGFNSKMIITGDLSQIDLQKGITSGLMNAVELLRNINGISIVKFNKNDVMRHPIVEKIIEKYESE